MTSPPVSLECAEKTADLRSATTIPVERRSSLSTADKLGAVLRWNGADIESGRYRRLLYRFLVDHVPVVGACVWTWVRLSAAPGRFRVLDGAPGRETESAESRLERLAGRLYTNASGERLSLQSMLPELFTSMYRDGLFGGFVTADPAGEKIDCFVPIDPIDLKVAEQATRRYLALECGDKDIVLNRPDFYFVPFNASISQPYGRSILQSVPFVSYVEQQMVDDMRRASHNAGYHRLHVKITPPERMAAESDNAYTERINGYFDSTVKMIRSLDIDDNPVTWENVEFRQIGPDKPREVTNSWFMSHRSMVEEICAGTHLAPYLLGYSYGATTTWSGFKFDVVMRQVQSVQHQVGRFLEWLGNIDLALGGYDVRCRFEFDNSLAYQAREKADIEAGQIDSLIKLYQAGLIDRQDARERARTWL